MRALALVAACVLAGPAAAASWVTQARSIQPIADGVYVIIHKDAVAGGWPQGNTTVIVGQRGVFVIDACFLTKSAQEDIADIRRLTSKPVRWLLVTHFHIDHNGGASAYRDAFPDVQIIAHETTRRFMDDANPAFAANVIAPDGRPTTVLLPSIEKSLQSGLSDDGQPLSAAERTLLTRQKREIEAEIADYRHFRYEPPTLTFEHDLTIDLGGRQVEVKHLGRGNTPGDAIAWLPREKVLVTGDLLTWPVPYMRMGYPREWAEVLRTLRRLPARAIVPGHGAVLRDASPLDDVLALLDSVIAQVHEQAPRLPMNSQTKQPSVDELHIDLDQFRARMVGDDPQNIEAWKNLVDPGMIGGVNQGVVGRAYAEETGKL